MEDPRCKSQFDGVVIELEDPRYKGQFNGLVVEMEDPRCKARSIARRLRWKTLAARIRSGCGD